MLEPARPLDSLQRRSWLGFSHDALAEPATVGNLRPIHTPIGSLRTPLASPVAEEKTQVSGRRPRLARAGYVAPNLQSGLMTDRLIAPQKSCKHLSTTRRTMPRGSSPSPADSSRRANSFWTCEWGGWLHTRTCLCLGFVLAPLPCDGWCSVADPVSAHRTICPSPRRCDRC
jgi:hypothetical protein